jgi:MarR family transcriptional regulator, multiple antibiotic resistance protein MarR
MSKQGKSPCEILNLAENVSFLLGNTNLLKDRLLDQHLAEEDITAAQVKALFKMHFFNINRPSDICKSLGVDGGAVTRMLDRLEKKELISRSPDPTDRRSLLVAVTDKGREVIDRAMPLAVNAQKELVSALTEDEIQQLKQILRKILVAAGSACGLATPSLTDNKLKEDQ